MRAVWLLSEHEDGRIIELRRGNICWKGEERQKEKDFRRCCFLELETCGHGQMREEERRVLPGVCLADHQEKKFKRKYSLGQAEVHSFWK